MLTLSPMKIETSSSEETSTLGEKLGTQCSGGEIFLLMGDLGGGKTTFVKGLARGMDIEEPVTSPTFVLMNIYTPPAGGGCTGPSVLCHIDLYRLSDVEDVETTGIWDYAGSDDTVVAVEWPNLLLEGGFPPPYVVIRFSMVSGENKRRIEVEPVDR